MNANTEQRGVVAKRRLPSDFHTPSHTLQPWPQNHTADHAGDIGRIPAIGKAVTNPRARIWAALSPDKIPFDRESLAMAETKSNSRFFTNCYHQAAAIEPATGRKRSAQPRCASLARPVNGYATPGASGAGSPIPKRLFP